jgi:hypothetical protein
MSLVVVSISSALSKPKSANTLPLLSSNIDLSINFLLPHNNILITLLNQIYIRLRSFNTLLGLFLESMKHINSLSYFDCINGTVCICVMALNNFVNSTINPFKRFGTKLNNVLHSNQENYSINHVMSALPNRIQIYPSKTPRQQFLRESTEPSSKARCPNLG